VSPHYEVRRGAFLISTDPSLLDVRTIHAFLTGSYWARGISDERVRRSIENSLSFGLYLWEKQIGFARAISDRATFAYLADVFILERHRGQGLGLWLAESILGHPDLQGLRRISLMTRDAHSLYRKVGFAGAPDPARYMEIVQPPPADALT
jgi:GNAT superfamily N-acetyltransferase